MNFNFNHVSKLLDSKIDALKFVMALEYTTRRPYIIELYSKSEETLIDNWTNLSLIGRRK